MFQLSWGSDHSFLLCKIRLNTKRHKPKSIESTQMKIKVQGLTLDYTNYLLKKRVEEKIAENKMLENGDNIPNETIEAHVERKVTKKEKE